MSGPKFEELPNPVVLNIQKYLNFKDCLSLKATHPWIKLVLENEAVWRNYMYRENWFQRIHPSYEKDLQYILNNTPDKFARTRSFKDNVLRKIVYSHDATMLAAFGNGCRFWIYRGENELFYVNLQKKKNWRYILHMEFAPDDNHIFVTGCKNQSPFDRDENESLVYSIEQETVTNCFRLTFGKNMVSTWFDNNRILYTMNNGVPNRTRLILCEITMEADIIFVPILTFNQRITKIHVAQHVSPRTRKITQIADQAVREGKTLTEKLREIGLASGVDVDNMSELRGILDQESECLTCYQKHSHRNSAPVGECTCQCHHNTDKLLIFHGVDTKIYTKVVTENIIDEAKSQHRLRREPEAEDNADQQRLFAPLPLVNHFDTSDHMFNIGWSLQTSAMALSPNNKYVYITGTNREGPRMVEIKVTCIDLDTMVIKNVPDFQKKLWIENDFDTCISANDDFVAIFSANRVFIWSVFHRGNCVAELDLRRQNISSVALHPTLNQLLVTQHNVINVFQSSEVKRALTQ